MTERSTWQLHANVNADYGDAACRVTITMYDEAGYEVATKTWRRHVKGLQMDSLEWQALFAVDELVKLMSHVCGHDYHPVEVDEPLF